MYEYSFCPVVDTTLSFVFIYHSRLDSDYLYSLIEYATLRSLFADVVRCLGFGTAADHHVHHAMFLWNYGHLFMYWDWICGTYKDPKDVAKFNRGV